MIGSLLTRNLRRRIAWARYAAAPERRITGSAKAAREFVFFVRNLRRRVGGVL